MFFLRCMALAKLSACVSMIGLQSNAELICEIILCDCVTDGLCTFDQNRNNAGVRSNGQLRESRGSGKGKTKAR